MFKKTDHCIDLTEEETRIRIYNCVSNLSKNYQQVYKDRLSGRRIIDTANDIGLSKSRVGQIYRETIRAIEKELKCKMPDFNTNILDSIFLYKLGLALKESDNLKITENEKNDILKNRHKLAYDAQIKHIWRDKKGLLCIAYANNLWLCYGHR